MEDYKAKFERLMQRIDKLIVNGWIDENAGKAILKDFAVESEDERIRKSIIDLVEKQMPKSENKKWMISWLEKQCEKIDVIENFDTEFEKQVSHLIASTINKEYEYTSDFIKWTANALLNYAKHELEKQGEQKPNDKVETKFKAGDWIINSVGTLRHIVAVDKTGYETDKGWLTHDYYENCFHLWTIKDAKDGDVLTTKNFIFIFKNIDSDNGVRYYCHYEISNYEADDLFEVAFPQCVMGRVGNGLSYYSPATEEQCDLLFSKMKEAGYEWDSEKKELRKIGQKPEIKDDVLSRFAFYQYDNEILYLSSVFVEERSRKHGYGTKILNAAEEVAKTFGISKIRLKVETNSWMEEWYKRNGYKYLTSEGKYDWFEKQVEMKPQVNSALEVWKDMRLEVYQQASGNRHEPNYSDDSTKMFSLTDIDEIFEKVAEKEGERKQNVVDIISDLENYFATTTKEQQEKDWEKIKKWEEKHFNHDNHIEINPTNKVEPKFNVGDWLVCCNYEPEQIIGIKNNMYEMSNGDIRPINMVNNNHNIRLWTIKDAKDGDVLYECNEKNSFIFKELKTKHIGDIASYCDIFNDIFNPNEDSWTTLDIVPSTKEQYDLLFSKMKEAGYEWDSKKKELRKIEQKSTWSEDDERNYESAIWHIEKSCGKNGNVYNWLKSIKERYTWKPSEEQMKQLGWIAEQNKDNMIGKELMSLYQDLKKLKN